MPVGLSLEGFGFVVLVYAALIAGGLVIGRWREGAKRRA